MKDSLTLQSLNDTISTYGDKPAVIALQAEGKTLWSCASLADHVHRLAQGLVSNGIGQGQFVAILATNRPEWIIAALAVIAAGAVIVPLDVQLSDDLLRHVLIDSGTVTVFTTIDQLDRLERLDTVQPISIILLDGDSTNARNWRRRLSDQAGHLLPIRSSALAVLFYTSGTTGPPKGVPLTHANLSFQINSMLATDVVAKSEGIMLPLPLHHVFPFVVGMLASLAKGMPIVFPHALTGQQIIRAMSEEHVTTVLGVPRLFRAIYAGIESQVDSLGWLAAVEFKAGICLCSWINKRLGFRLGIWMFRPLRNKINPTLKVFASGGAKLEPSLGWKLEGMGWRVLTGYGLSETAPTISMNTLGNTRIGSAGKPIPGVEIRIDSSAVPGTPKPVKPVLTTESNIQGEIVVRGPNVFSGYRNLPAENEKSFIGEGWFRTGDLGYIDNDGYLYITGRIVTVIVTESGENIQPDEVECVYEDHAMINEVGVLQNNGRLVAIIVPELSTIRENQSADLTAVIRQAVHAQSQRLPSYQRITDYVITRESLARTRLGKLRRHILPQRFAAAKYSETEAAETQLTPISLDEMSDEDLALLDHLEVKKTWDWLVARYADQRLTPDTIPDLDLGVDSLEWVNLTLEIGRLTGVELSEQDIGDIVTIRDLLRLVAEASKIGQIRPSSQLLNNPMSALSEQQERWLKPVGSCMSALRRLLLIINRILFINLFRLRVTGLEHIPEQGAYLIAPNHASYLDAPAIAAALGNKRLGQTYWAGATDVMFINPALRFGSRLFRIVPVDARRAALSSLALAAVVLMQHKNLVWFPEGQRSLNGTLRPFKPGLGVLLQNSPVPIIPAFIDGTYDAMPPNRSLPRLRPITVQFGAPLQVEALEKRGKGENAHTRIMHALHKRVAELSTQNRTNGGSADADSTERHCD